MNFIGIDLGTSAVKIVLVNGDGKILKQVSEEYAVYCPENGWSEQNPEEWFNAVLRGLKKLETSDVSGIAVAGQMHGLVVLDKDDAVIRPCILWNDGRSEKQTKYLNLTVGVEKLKGLTANQAFAGFTAPKILWLKENEPHNFDKISKIMLPKDYIVYRLTGVFATDFSDAAGTLLLDVKNKRWSNEMCVICGICEGQLPKLHESGDAVGVVKKQIAQELGWSVVTVAAGAADNAAAALGTGAVSNGGCNISLGTSGTLFVSNDKFSLPENSALHSFCHADGGFCLMGCILSAASANKWWTSDILGANFDLSEQADKLLGKNDVYFAPYLSGERCPHNDVTVRGAFFGLNFNVTKQQMSLAVLEGVCFALRDCLELVRECNVSIERCTVCGGGANNRLWLKILSNVLNLEIQTVETEQGPAYGAAMLAMVACGKYKTAAEAANVLTVKRTVAVPDNELVENYDKRYKKYKTLYCRLKDF